MVKSLRSPVKCANALELIIKEIVEESSLIASIVSARGLIKAKAISSGFKLLFNL